MLSHDAIVNHAGGRPREVVRKEGTKSINFRTLFKKNGRDQIGKTDIIFWIKLNKKFYMEQLTMVKIC